METSWREEPGAVGLVQIQREADLVAGVGVEVGPAVPGTVAGLPARIGDQPVAVGVDELLGGPRAMPPGDGLEPADRLDADDLRAPIGQQGRGVGPREDHGEVEDADALQGQVVRAQVGRGARAGLEAGRLRRDFGGVLVQPRRRTARNPRRLRCRERPAGILEGAGGGMLDGLPVAPGAEVGVLEQVGHGIDGAGDDPRTLGRPPDLDHAALHEPAGEDAFERFGILGALDLDGVAEARVVLELGHVHHVVDVGDARRRDVDVDVAVLAGPHRRHGDLALAIDVPGVLMPHEHGRAAVGAPRLGLHDREVDVVAAPPELAAKHGGNGRSGGVRAGKELHDVAPQLHGTAAGRAGAVVGAAEGVVDDLGPQVVPVRPGLAEVGDGGHHEAGVMALQLLVGEAQ